jgi:magnesium-transporting ATPase (P-type)
MNKKNWVIVCFGILFLFILSSVISAQNISGLSEEELADLNKLTVAANPQKWGEMLEGWKQSFLQNELIAGMNSFFTSINILFLILFGTNYSMSLFMFFVIVFWVFFLIQIAGALRMTSIFSKSISWIIAVGLTIVLAQVRLYSALSNLLFNNSFILNAEPWVGALVYIGIIILLVFLGSVSKLVEKKLEKNKELLAKEEETLHRNVLETYAKALMKTSDE